jgi:ParB family chromosome partitioning protein
MGFQFSPFDHGGQQSAAGMRQARNATRGAPGLENGAICYIDIDKIEVRARLRELDEEALPQLQESLSERGLLHPILIVFEDRGDGPRPVLVAGLQRLEAGRRLGWHQILCQVIDAPDIERELIEIDENVARVDLSPATQAIYLGRRCELYELLHGPAKARCAHAANRAMGKGDVSANLAPTFAAATAAVTGAAERSIQRSVARSAALGPETLKRVSGTSLDRGTELDSLAELPPQVRDDLVERAAGGERVSATATLEAATAEPAPAAERTTQPEPGGPAEAEPAAALPADPTQDEPPAKGLPPADGQAPEPMSAPTAAGGSAETAADYCGEAEAALAALQRAWLGASVHGRSLFLSWLAAGWATPNQRK